jgi:hypothetical protein
LLLGRESEHLEVGERGRIVNGNDGDVVAEGYEIGR